MLLLLSPHISHRKFFLFVFRSTFGRKGEILEVMAKNTSTVIFRYLAVVSLLIVLGCSSNLDMQGHMEKLGMQRKSEGHIEILNELPSPVEFFEKYVKPGKPVVFKDAAKQMPAYKNWNDEYLR